VSWKQTWKKRSNRKLETDLIPPTRSFAARLLNRLDRYPLSLWVVLSLAGYALLAFWFPLLPHYDDVPLADVRSLAPSLAGGLAYALLLCLLFAFFAIAYRRVRSGRERPRILGLVGASLLFALPLLLVYPINANDLYRYVIRGRIQSVYSESPFVVPPDGFPDDPFLPLAGEWAGATSPYGPLWELAASGITRVGGDSLLFGLLAFKLLGLLAFTGSAVLLWFIFSPTDKRGEEESANAASARAANVLLWVWNPALLLIFVVDGHNDALMIFCLLLGFYFMQRDHAAPGFLLMLLGPLVKPIGLLALPLFFITVWRARPSVSARLRFLVVILVGGMLLVLITFLPFGDPWQLAQRLIQEAATMASFSPTATLILASHALDFDLALTFRRVAGFATLLFLCLVLWLLWKTWRGRSAVRGTADIYFGYLLQALNFRIWYAAWPFPWLLLDAGTGRQKPGAAFRLGYGLWFLLASQLSVVLYGHIRVYLLDGSQLFAHILGMILVFVLPFILAKSGAWRW
jgi:hypothetical protein